LHFLEIKSFNVITTTKKTFQFNKFNNESEVKMGDYFPIIIGAITYLFFVNLIYINYNIINFFLST